MGRQCIAAGPKANFASMTTITVTTCRSYWGSGRKQRSQQFFSLTLSSADGKKRYFFKRIYRKNLDK
jgi:hypothetical protein